MKPVRVLIVDDQALFRQGLAALLRGRSEVEVVAEAESGASALVACERAQPDVVLLDMKMPGMSGPECARALRERFPSLQVLALTTFDDDETVFAALKAGALGYLLKDVGAELLVDAIVQAAAGRASMDGQVLAKVLSEFQRTAPCEPQRAPVQHGLSERERVVLKGLAQGKSNKEIAQGMRITEGTVKNHVTSIFEKLGVPDRTRAALRARELGLG